MFFKIIQLLFNKKEKNLSHFKFLNKEDDKYIFKLSNGFILNASISNNIVYISFKDNNSYFLCFEIDENNDDYLSILNIINLKIFTLNSLSFELFLNQYIKINPSKNSLKSLLENKNDSHISAYNKNLYHKISIKEFKFIKDIYKIKIFLKNRAIRIYILNGYFFNLNSLYHTVLYLKRDNISSSIFYNFDYIYSVKNYRHFKDKMLRFGVSDKIDFLVKKIDYKLDIKRIYTLNFLGFPVNIYKYSRNGYYILSQMPSSVLSKFYDIKNKRILKYSKDYYFSSRKKEFIDDKKNDTFFVLIDFSDNKIVQFELFKSDEKSLEYFQLDFFKRFDNIEKFFEKFPSPGIKIDMIESGVITESDKPTLDLLSLHEMIKV